MTWPACRVTRLYERRAPHVNVQVSVSHGGGVPRVIYLRPIGLIHVTVTLTPVAGSDAFYEADFLVDTGATDSLAPGKELRRIGVQPVGRTAYELADGTLHEYEFGLVRIEFMGEVTAGRVIFGPDDAEPLLGVTALESVGITVDPVSRTLTRLPAIPLKRAAVRRPPVRSY